MLWSRDLPQLFTNVRPREEDGTRIWDCLVPRRLSENVRAKEGGKETTGETSLRLPSVPFPWSLAVHHQSLVSRSPLPCEKRSAWGGGWIWDLLACSVWAQRKGRHLVGISLYQKLITPYQFLPVHRRCVIFLFVLFEKHRLAHKRSERSRTSGARERNLYTIALAVNKSPAVYILSPGLDGLWRENRESVNRLYRNLITNNFREQSHFPTRQHWAKNGLILERFGDIFYTAAMKNMSGRHNWHRRPLATSTTIELRLPRTHGRKAARWLT